MGNALHNSQPFKFASVDVGPRSAAPLLGQHTEEILHEVLGLSKEETAALAEIGVLS